MQDDKTTDPDENSRNIRVGAWALGILFGTPLALIYIYKWWSETPDRSFQDNLTGPVVILFLVMIFSKEAVARSPWVQRRLCLPEAKIDHLYLAFSMALCFSIVGYDITLTPTENMWELLRNFIVLFFTMLGAQYATDLASQAWKNRKS